MNPKKAQEYEGFTYRPNSRLIANRPAQYLLTASLLLGILLLILQSPKPPPKDLHFQHTTQDDEWISSSYFTPPQIRLDATDRLIRRDGRQPAWILNRARAVYELDRFSEALELFDEYLKVKPEDKQARIWREQVERMR